MKLTNVSPCTDSNKHVLTRAAGASNSPTSTALNQPATVAAPRSSLPNRVAGTDNNSPVETSSSNNTNGGPVAPLVGLDGPKWVAAIVSTLTAVKADANAALMAATELEKVRFYMFFLLVFFWWHKVNQ